MIWILKHGWKAETMKTFIEKLKVKGYKKQDQKL